MMKTRHGLRTYISSNFKQYGSREILAKFLEKTKKGTLGTLLKKIRKTGNTYQRYESGRPKYARTQENVTTVDELVGLLSQEDQRLEHIVQHVRYPARRVASNGG